MFIFLSKKVAQAASGFHKLNGNENSHTSHKKKKQMPIFRFCTDERVFNAEMNVSVLILGFLYRRQTGTVSRLAAHAAITSP